MAAGMHSLLPCPSFPYPLLSLILISLQTLAPLFAMTVDDSEMQRLWKLTNELTAQLVFNRSATLELKQQLAELQTRTPQGLEPVLGALGNVQGESLEKTTIEGLDAPRLTRGVLSIQIFD